MSTSLMINAGPAKEKLEQISSAVMPIPNTETRYVAPDPPTNSNWVRDNFIVGNLLGSGMQ